MQLLTLAGIMLKSMLGIGAPDNDVVSNINVRCLIFTHNGIFKITKTLHCWIEMSLFLQVYLIGSIANTIVATSPFYMIFK